jgi:hypothetical protein
VPGLVANRCISLSFYSDVLLSEDDPGSLTTRTRARLNERVLQCGRN